MDSDTALRRIPRDYPPFLYIPCLAHVRDAAGADTVGGVVDGAEGVFDAIF